MASRVKISQNDVDAVASLVEAADELGLEPFFGKDEQFSFSGTADGPATFHLGDRFHFRLALISFRRIWLPSEPSHWRNVVRILTRDGMPARISNNAAVQAQTIEALISRDAGFLKGIKGSRVIDLWLNTVFAHGGITGPNKRGDFQAVVEKHGQGRFEYAFRTQVKWTGEAFRFLSANAAGPALTFFENDMSLQPSFRLDAAFGTKRKEKTRDGDVIIRQASSEHFSEETFEQRFHRILKRRNFDTLKNIIPQFDCTTVEAIRALLASDSFADFLQMLGGDLEILDGDLYNDGAIKKAFAEGFSSSCGIQDGPFQVAGYAFVSKQARVRTSGNAVATLDRQLAAFKHELLQD
jgi:hypothetical protein